ncbi:hypothetical protein L208DRAFT_208350 [Tricholoma matsutake]|nr:hypothetical protein L208DRAFT_208350 [Tricholoma matsutake 945]
MRRFASVFASKREKHEATIKRATTIDSNPPPLLQDNAQSSASSSSGSASLQTPDDDHHRIPSTLKPKKSWKSWLKVRAIKHHENHIPDWPPQPGIAHDFEEQDDFVSDESELLSVPNSPSIHPYSPAKARQNLKLIVENSLVPPPSCSPFIQHSDTSPIFPWSCNPASDFPRKNSMLSNLLKTRLLRRLEDSSRSLSRSEQLYIAPLGSRQISPVARHSSSSLPFDEPAPWKKTLISLSSPGLHRWISRPCFEDRYSVVIPTDEGVFRQRVTGTAFAVASLEYSEALDAMAGYIDDVAPSTTSFTPDVSSFELQATMQTSTSPSSSQPPSPTHSRNAPYIAVPSPLRNEHSPVTSPALSGSTQAPATTPTGGEPPVKRGVRFAEDEKEDVIPLGYVLRMKRKREEKAKFLRAEHDRRVLEEQRARLEEERRIQEAERTELEKERKAWERERKAQEERKQRMYQEEVIAARLRREAARVGGVSSSNNGTGSSLIGPEGGPFPSSASSTTSLRDPERNRLPQPTPQTRDSSRQKGTMYDLAQSLASASPPTPRRPASERNLPMITTTSGSIAHSPPSSSPGSSRSPSVRDGHSTPSLIASGSGSGTRPPSMYSSVELSSSEDVRQQRAAAASMTNRSKRNSLATSTSSLRLNPDRAASFPGWVGSNQSSNYVPAVPMIPTMVPAYVMMDMPLLPPTAPFMLHQYPRQQHGQRSPAPTSPSRGRLSSVNSSKERVYLPQQGQEGQLPRSPSQSPHQPGSRHTSSLPAASGSASGSRRSTHERHGSGDSRRASMPLPQSPTMQQGQHQRPRLNSQHSHGRPAVPRSHTGPPVSYGAGTLQAPSPWTGLPSQTGKPLAAMPVPKSQSQSNLRSGRRRAMVA